MSGCIGQLYQRDEHSCPARVLKELPVIDFLPDGVLITNAKSIIVDANEIACNMFGYDRVDLINQSVHRLVPMHVRAHHPAMADSIIASMKLTEMASRRPVQAQHSDGHTFEVSIHLAPMYLATEHSVEPFVTCVIRDVSEHNNALRAQMAADVHRRMLEEFLRTINHQVRTSLHAVTNSMALVQTDLKANYTDDTHVDPAVQKVLTSPSFKTLSANISSMERLLTNLVDLRNLQEHNMATQTTRLNVRHAMQDIIDSLKEKWSERNQSICLSVDDSVPIVLIDHNLLSKAIQALLDNAIQFSPNDASILLSVNTMSSDDRLSFTRTDLTRPFELVRASYLSPQSSSDEDVRLVFAVCDNGIGVSPSSLRNMELGLLHNDQGTTRRSETGIGMGLAIAKHCTEQMNGTLKVRSGTVDGWKTVFTLKLTAPRAPVIRAETPQVLAVVADRAESAPTSLALPECITLQRNISQPMIQPPKRFTADAREEIVRHITSAEWLSERQQLKVLIVEDNLINVKVLRQCLKTKNINNITICYNGLEAVKLFEKSLSEICLFDIILMDCEMPIMDGFTTTATLRSVGINIPIIALTANSTSSAQDKCRQSGMDLFLTKPVKIETLMYAIAVLPPFNFYSIEHSPYYLALSSTYAATEPPSADSSRATSAGGDGQQDSLHCGFATVM